MIRIEKPTLRHVVNMQNMVIEEIQNGIILPRSDDEVSTNIRSYTIALDDDEIIGYSALHFHTTALAEVRSLIVNDKYRGKGVGLKIVNALLDEARKYGLKQVFALTYQRNFFEKLGFAEIAKSELPAQKIWADCVKCKRFPVCDEIALIYNL